MIVGRDGDTTVIRLPRGSLKLLSEVARANGRSRNTEMVVRVMATLERDHKRIQREEEAA